MTFVNGNRIRRNELVYPIHAGDRSYPCRDFTNTKRKLKPLGSRASVFIMSPVFKRKQRDKRKHSQNKNSSKPTFQHSNCAMSHGVQLLRAITNKDDVTTPSFQADVAASQTLELEAVSNTSYKISKQNQKRGVRHSQCATTTQACNVTSPISSKVGICARSARLHTSSNWVRARIKHKLE